jgi:hypothetical protein
MPLSVPPCLRRNRSEFVMRSKAGSHALRVTAEDISLDAGPGREAGRALLDHTSDA